MTADGTGGMELDPRGFFVYLLWGADPDRPLYVGKSSNLLARVGEHLRDRDRRPYIERVAFIRSENAAHASRVETDLIWRLNPVWNVAMNGRPFSVNPRHASPDAAALAVTELGNRTA